MSAYYNEIDPFAAEWLRALIAAGHIADGIVDTRSIEDVTPADLSGFTQCHFFAGIGVWSHALRRAGWPDDRPVWTGSCPCQPFSAAGKGGGFDDERHLWPSWFWLIEQRRPAIVFGEQVAGKDAEPWIDLVSDDLEALGYAVGAVPFPSAGVGAPHIRDRLYWVADADRGQRRGLAELRRPERDGQDAGRPQGSGEPEPRRDAGGLADADDARSQGRGFGRDGAGERAAGPGGVAGGLALPGGERREGQQVRLQPGQSRQASDEAGRGSGTDSGGPAARPGPVNGLWADADWLLCRDGKWRPVEPGTSPLVAGTPARVGRLRGYGNAINAEAATAWVEAYLDTRTIEGGSHLGAGSEQGA